MIKTSNKKNQSGLPWQAGKIKLSAVLIILAIVLILVIIAAYLITTRIRTQPQPPAGETPPTTVEPPKPVYDTTIDNVRFLLLSSSDLGPRIKSNIQFQNDATTTERFIKVIVGAQNKGKIATDQFTWDIGNIVDSEGRNFASINNKVYWLIPNPDPCGSALKPEFTPTPCTKYYEVSKQSKGLKVYVKVSSPKKQEALLDLNQPF